MPGPDTLLVIAVAVLIAVVLLVAWRLWPRAGGGGRDGQRRSRLQEMSRDDSIGYFRDFNQRGAGVREEDRSGRWGAGDDS